MEELREEISKILKETLVQEFVPAPIAAPVAPVAAPQAVVKPKTVRFNKGLENEYQITFSERGFLIDGTRMSFEEIENAISKQYTITLNSGTILDAVKMQQILKYKNVF